MSWLVNHEYCLLLHRFKNPEGSRTYGKSLPIEGMKICYDEKETGVVWSYGSLFEDEASPVTPAATSATSFPLSSVCWTVGASGVPRRWSELAEASGVSSLAWRKCLVTEKVVASGMVPTAGGSFCRLVLGPVPTIEVHRVSNTAAFYLLRNPKTNDSRIRSSKQPLPPKQEHSLMTIRLKIDTTETVSERFGVLWLEVECTECPE